MQHYLSEKQHDPANKSAVVLVLCTGRMSKTPAYLSMKYGEPIPAGTTLLVDVTGKPIPTTYPVDVYVDRPNVKPASLAKHSKLAFMFRESLG